MKRLKLSILISLCLVLLVVLWADLTRPIWLEALSFHPTPKAPLRTRETIENLLIAVAPPAVTSHSEKEGKAVQEKIALHMENDLGLKVLRLSKPVSMGAGVTPDYIEGHENAVKTLESTGADLLIWGDDRNPLDKDDWNLYVTTSARARCLARDTGYSMLENTHLSQLSEGDMLNVLDWVTSSWRGLINISQGMYIAQTMKPMILKINTILGLAAEKRMSDSTRSAVKRNMAFLLAEYGNETMDIPSLQNAVRLTREVLSTAAPADRELQDPYADMESVNIMAKCLFRLGTLQNDHEKLLEGEEVLKKGIKGVNKKYDPEDWGVLQIELGLTQEYLGHRTGDMDKVREAIAAFESAEGVITQDLQPSQWRSLRTGLGGAYLFLGARGTDNIDLKKALAIYQPIASHTAQTYAPSDYASAETNLGLIYALLGERDKSPEEVKQGLQHSDEAVSLCHAMGDAYGEGFALANVGMAQYHLGQYTSDDGLMARSLLTFKRSQELVPQAQDLGLWVKCQSNALQCRQFMALKTFDPAELQSVLAGFVDMKKLYDPQASRPIWTEINLHQASIEAVLGNLDCGTDREDMILNLMEGILPGLDPQRDSMQLALTHLAQAGALNHKGAKLNQPSYIRQAIPLMEAGMASLKPGDLNALKVFFLDSLVSAYANLALKGGAENFPTARARAVLDDFEKAGLETPLVVEEATHDQDAARLERALAGLEKDQARLTKARPLAEKAYELFQKNGYTFCMAMDQKELAEVDLLSGQLAGMRPPSARPPANSGRRRRYWIPTRIVGTRKS